MAREQKHTLLRTLGAILLVLLAVMGGAILWLRHPVKKEEHYTVLRKHTDGTVQAAEKKEEKTEPDYVALLKEHLPSFVQKATHGKYTLSLQDLAVDVAGNSLHATGLVLRPRSDSRGDKWYVSIPSIRVTGIKWLPLVSDKTLECADLAIAHPTIVLDAGQTEDEATRNGEKLASQLRKIAIGTVHIQDPDITYHRPGKDPVTYTLKTGSILLNNWSFSPDSANPQGFFYAKSGVLKLGKMQYKRPGAVYTVYSSGVSFTSTDNTLRFINLRVAPLEANNEYYKRLGVQHEIYQVNFPEVAFVGIDWRKLHRNMLLASSMDLVRPSVDIFLSRFPPPNTQSRLEKFPHQLLQHLSTRVNIRRVNVTGGYVKYTELNKNTNKAGVAIFNNIHGTLTNVTNVSDALQKNSICKAHLSGQYKGKSDINTDWSLHLGDPNGTFTMKGTLTDMDESEISDDAKALSLVGINSIHIERMDVMVEGDQEQSHGRFTMQYNGLKVELEKMQKDGKMNDRDVSSWLANQVYIFPDNPMPNDIIRSVNTSIPRDRMRSFFALIWANMREGVDKTVIKDQKLAERQSEITDGSKHKKGVIKAFFKSVFRKRSR